MRIRLGTPGFTRLIPMLVTLAMAACDSATSPPERLPPVSAALAVGKVGHSTTGGGVIDLTTALAGYARSTFSAVQHANGKVSGRFRQVREVGGLLVDFHGEVTCVAVDAATGRAWVGGVVTQNNSTHPAFLTSIHEVGDDVWFRVVDYGEGANAPQADRSTVYGFAGAAGIVASAEYCATKPWPANDERTFPLTAGNIQVRP